MSRNKPSKNNNIYLCVRTIGIFELKYVIYTVMNHKGRNSGDPTEQKTKLKRRTSM